MNSFDFSELDLDVDPGSVELSNKCADDVIIDFSSLDVSIKGETNKSYKQKKTKEENKYTTTHGNAIEYDNDTILYYRALRTSKIDPILDIEVDERYAFKFPYEWDPYTGERLEKDPYGSLYFDPDSLIKYFWSKRLENLWYQPSDEDGGYFEGYYGDAIGNGPNFKVKGRGNFPEWYIFRIPICDCYLTKDNNHQFVTFGPKLTNDEIEELYNLAIKKDRIMGRSTYKKLFGKNRPDLLKMKKLWDQATSKNPITDNTEKYSLAEFVQKCATINRKAVDALKEIQG